MTYTAINPRGLNIAVEFNSGEGYYAGTIRLTLDRWEAKETDSN